MSIARKWSGANENFGLHLNYKWDQDTALNVLFHSDQYPMLLHDIPAMWWFNCFRPVSHQVTEAAEKNGFPQNGKEVEAGIHQRIRLHRRQNSTKFFEPGVKHAG